MTVDTVFSVLGKLLDLFLGWKSGRKDYVEWRRSPEGQAHYTAEQNARFFEAVEKGDTAVIDTAIRERQRRIDALRGLVVALFLLSGCSTYSIPVDPLHVTPGELLAGQRSYCVKDARVVDPDGKSIMLAGQWHIVGPEFLKEHFANQQDLIVALEALRDKKTPFRYAIWVPVGLVLLGGLWIFRRKPREAGRAGS